MTTLTADIKPELGLQLTVCLCHGQDPLCCAPSLPPPHWCCHLLDHSAGLTGWWRHLLDRSAGLTRLWCHLIQLLCLQLNCLSWCLEPTGVSSSSTSKHKLALVKRCTEAGNVYKKHKSDKCVKSLIGFLCWGITQNHSHDRTRIKQLIAD